MRSDPVAPMQGDVIADLNARLGEQLEELAAELVGGGPSKDRSEWLGARKRKGGPGDSLLIRLTGARRGSWFWHARGIGGDLVGLVAELRTQGDMRKACAWVRMWLGGQPLPDAAERRRRSEKRARHEAEEERRDKDRRIRWARAIFEAARPGIGGTPVERYLAGRGIDLRRLPRVPSFLRFASLRHPDANRVYPAMVAAVKSWRGELVAIQRTWLVERAGGQWDRLRPGTDNFEGKHSLGAYRGGSVHVWNGEHIDWSTGEVIAGALWSGPRGVRALHACEGVEDALSLVLMDPSRCIVATLGISGFGALGLPRNVESLTWWADADVGNDATHKALVDGLALHEAAGRRVCIRKPPDGFKDWNEAHRLSTSSAPVTASSGARPRTRAAAVDRFQPRTVLEAG